MLKIKYNHSKLLLQSQCDYFSKEIGDKFHIVSKYLYIYIVHCYYDFVSFV